MQRLRKLKAPTTRALRDLLINHRIGNSNYDITQHSFEGVGTTRRVQNKGNNVTFHPFLRVDT